MAKKQLVHAWMTYDNYLWLKVNVENISKYFNDLTTIARQAKPLNNQEEAKLEQDKAHLEKKAYTIQEELHRINIELLSIQEKKTAEQQETLDKAIRADQSIKSSRALDYD